MPPILVEKPTEIVAAGEPPKQIREYIGRVNTRTDAPVLRTWSVRQGGANQGKLQISTNTPWSCEECCTLNIRWVLLKLPRPSRHCTARRMGSV